MKLSLDLKTTLSQTLTPQQIQYLKLLQLPLIQMEQQVIRELEQNPMLEEVEVDAPIEYEEGYDSDFTRMEDLTEPSVPSDYDGEYSVKAELEAQKDPFEFYKMLWADSDSTGSQTKSYSDEDEDSEYFQIKNVVTISEEILQQLRMTNLSHEEIYLGEQIIGNVDNDGYLRRDLNDIVRETNDIIAELNYQIKVKNDKENNKVIVFDNPSKKFAVSKDALKIVDREIWSLDEEDELTSNNEIEDLQFTSDSELPLIKTVNIEQAEKVLKIIQTLDPPGFASRNLQECLIAQCKLIPKKSPAQKLALDILEKAYEAFAMKHYHIIKRQLSVSEDKIKEAIDVIKRLNPKPGGIESEAVLNTVIPDFTVFRNEENNELMINVNDSRIPVLRLNQAYDKLKKEAKLKVFNKETREWIRNKYEEAKFLIQAIRQRKNTMLKVMTAIAQRQKDFFYFGPTALKPLIYKDISTETGLDISTVCRIVNGKYVQTEYGTFELKYFFSESLPNEDGEEVSTTVIKQVIKDIIAEEPKNKPYSDDKIVKELQKKGYHIARRTVAKYREQMKIPVARLRREL
ncbi:RNA polymerase sigma-54 factor [Bacteroidetes/Chlorobi group bacterium ChocPot_Mid]|nr:MAG: RNA polymerase sigma-54 factor [Bacteroidetes/Chlorobi group bacterium ChocPot_Mid]